MQVEGTYGVIYLLIFPNGKYVGQTIQGLNVRWKGHLRDTKNGSNLPVHNAIRKYYNKDNLTNKVKCEVIGLAYSLEELNNLEKYYIIMYNTFNNSGNNPTGYNMTEGGDGCKGYKFTKEQKDACVVREEKRKTEHPELAIAHGIYMKQLHIDKPELAIAHGINLKQLYDDEPERRVKMSNIKHAQNENNPEMARQQSELKLMFYEDKFASKLINTLSEKSTQQWQNIECRQKIMDEKRERFSKSFKVYKNGIFIKEFDYVPDCAKELFGTRNGSLISAVLKGRRKSHRGYVFEYAMSSST